MENTEPNASLVGKTCWYRPLYSERFKTANIVSCRGMAKLSGEIITLALLDNEEEVDTRSIYFQCAPEEVSELSKKRDGPGGDKLRARLL